MKTAVILFNLGGPDALKSVRPFLFNLFNDPAIIPLPSFVRFFLAHLISFLRYKKAQSIYKRMGGKSPLLENTIRQATALQNKLGADYSVHVCMRYWHPRIKKVLQDLKKDVPDQIILLPLYPQYSTTTTKSSIDEFLKSTLEDNIFKNVPTRIVYSYEDHPLFIKSHVELIQETLDKISDKANVVLLFSAHGIPLDCIQSGDPYQKHIETSVKEIMKFYPNLQFEICYQSKVGPKKWLEPDAAERITFYAKSHKKIVVIPIAFVSDHSETLVELDQDYALLAKQNGADMYCRVPSLQTNNYFIDCLKNVVETAND